MFQYRDKLECLTSEMTDSVIKTYKLKIDQLITEITDSIIKKLKTE